MVGGVVAVFATASIVVGQLIGSGRGRHRSGAVSADWNRIVLVDDRTGRVIVDDADGEEMAADRVRRPVADRLGHRRRDPGRRRRRDRRRRSTSATRPSTSSTSAPTDIVDPSGSALTMIAPRPDGGRAVLVHGPSGDVIDTDSFAPVVGARYEFADARSSASGRDVFVTDSGNFQSVLFSFDRDEPSFFPGLALAVDADLVVTAQNVGGDATISVFDHDGEPITTGRTPSVRAGMITGAGVVLVTVDGESSSMSSSDGETSEAGRLDIGTVESGDVTTERRPLGRHRCRRHGDRRRRGETRRHLDEQRPDRRRPSPRPGRRALRPSPTRRRRTADRLVDLTDGIGARRGEPATNRCSTDASGCSAATSTSAGFDLLSADGVQQFQTGDTCSPLSLDGRRRRRRTLDSRVVLLGRRAADDADRNRSISARAAGPSTSRSHERQTAPANPTDEPFVEIVRPGHRLAVRARVPRIELDLPVRQRLQGHPRHDATDLNQGCCSLGAHFGDGPAGEAEAMNVDAYAAMLTPEQFQFHARRPRSTDRPTTDGANGIFGDAERTHTRVVDGACIFLNRPGSPAARAVHSTSPRSTADESPTEWKPSVCWQLPLRIDWEEIDADTERATVRRWTRADWGDHGRTMAWCCTERGDGRRGVRRRRTGDRLDGRRAHRPRRRRGVRRTPPPALIGVALSVSSNAEHPPGERTGVLAVIHEHLAVDERVVVAARPLDVAAGAVREVVDVLGNRQMQTARSRSR